MQSIKFWGGLLALLFWGGLLALLGAAVVLPIVLVTQGVSVALNTAALLAAEVTIVTAIVTLVRWWWRQQRAAASKPQKQSTEAPQERPQVEKRLQGLFRVSWIMNDLDKQLSDRTELILDMRERPDALDLPNRNENSPGLPRKNTIPNIFAACKVGLLILGGPGSGKTIAMLQIAKHLFEDSCKDPKKPVPIVFELGSWHKGQTLREWFAQELHRAYHLAPTTAVALIDNGRVWPLLDGLDEVSEGNREACIQAINNFQENPELDCKLVVCSRPSAVIGLKKKLHFDRAIELQPPTDQQVKDYLKYPGHIPRTAQVITHAIINDDSADADFLRSPFVLNIIVSISLAEPKKVGVAQLLEKLFTRKNLLDEKEWWDSLFEYYVDSRFHWGGYKDRVKNRESIARGLRWLARTLREHNNPTLYLPDMQASWLGPHLLRWLVIPGVAVFTGIIAGLLCGLVDGLVIFSISEPVRSMRVAIRNGVLVGLLVAVFAGVVAGYESHAPKIKPLEPVRVAWSWSAVRRAWRSWKSPKVLLWTLAVLVVAVAAGLLLGNVLGTLSADQAFGKLGALLVVGIVGEYLGGLSGGVAAVSLILLAIVIAHSITPREIEIEKLTPGARMHETAYNGLKVGFVGFLFGFFPYGMVLGIPTGLVVGLKFGGATYLRYLALRFLLALTGATPWRFVPFLKEAERLDFLRPAGAGYHFAHRKLLDHFADYSPAETAGTSTLVNPG